MKNGKRKNWFSMLLILVILLLLSCIFALCTGSAGIPIRNIPEILINGSGTVEHSILFHIRLPRLMLALSIGGALSLAGVILQGMFRNPLVEPYTLGISGGASLGVCLNILFKWYALIGVIAYPLSGFLGAILVIVIVYSISMKKGDLKTNSMLLIGVMISFVSSSLVMLLMAISHSEDLQSIIFWIMGSLDEPNMILVKMAVAGSITGLLLSYCFCLDLNALALGEEEAIHLGVQTERSKRYLFIIASILTGLSVSVAGIIMFVGLIVPHFMRMTVGSDHRILLIGSFLAGASFLTVCDVISRTIVAPLELPVGVITGIIGGVVFIYVLSRRQVSL
ncbi:MAG: iron ABC transporter permease [Desulfobacteraceae bacterium]|nr:MAG: iron ABC transporter permease [Desulfobacteraceae bacterium]